MTHPTTQRVSLPEREERKREEKKKANNQDWERPLTDCPRSRAPVPERSSATAVHSRGPAVFVVEFRGETAFAPIFVGGKRASEGSSPRHARCRK